MTAANLPVTRERLEYLDSIRGIAALYVVMGHVLVGMHLDQLPLALRWVSRCLESGNLAVSLFIVLSGYCLGLPVAKTGGFSLTKGFRSYIFRRARRIYPPYLAAMAISLGVLAVLPDHVIRRSYSMATFLPAFTWSNITSHLLMFHNLDHRWLFKINAPFWSVATEWQIYFFLPLMLLTASRIGWIASSITALFLALLPIFIFRRFECAAPWFLSLFVMGVGAAYVTHSPIPRYRYLANHPSWPVIACVGAMATVVLLCSMPSEKWGWKAGFASSVTWGVACAAFLIWIYSPGKLPAVLRQGLHAKPLLFVGTISYSLYLTHMLAVTTSEIVLSYAFPHLSTTISWWVRMGSAPFTSIALATIFYFPFERPFLNVRKNKEASLTPPSPASDPSTLAVVQ